MPPGPAARILDNVAHPLPPVLMPGPGALTAEQTLKASTLVSMSSAIMSAAADADIHAGVTPSPVPPHGPGVVIDGSPTVPIDNLPASRR